MSYAYPTFTEVTNKPNSTLSAKYKLYLYREGYLDGPDQVYHAIASACQTTSNYSVAIPVVWRACIVHSRSGRKS